VQSRESRWRVVASREAAKCVEPAMLTQVTDHPAVGRNLGDLKVPEVSRDVVTEAPTLVESEPVECGDAAIGTQGSDRRQHIHAASRFTSSLCDAPLGKEDSNFCRRRRVAPYW